jgi:hypothetical protein
LTTRALAIDDVPVGRAHTHPRGVASHEYRLGSWLASDGKDTEDVEKRIKQATGAPGSLLKHVIRKENPERGSVACSPAGCAPCAKLNRT